MIFRPARIKAILSRHNSGTCLASTDDDRYIVGLDYTVGQHLTQWDPLNDYYCGDADTARQKYMEYVGLSPRTGNTELPPEWKGGNV